MGLKSKQFLDEFSKYVVMTPYPFVTDLDVTQAEISLLIEKLDRCLSAVW